MSKKNKKAEPPVITEGETMGEVRLVTALALVKTAGGWVMAQFKAPLSEAAIVSEPDLKIVAADKFKTAVAAQLQGDGQ